jgi:hypothetical protein
MLVRCQREIELLEYLIKEPECESGIATSEEKCSPVPDNKRVSQALVGTRIYSSFQTNDVFAGTEGSVDEYDVVIKEIYYKLSLKD